MSEKISVLLTTEGTYPFHQGGVSTWSDMLVKRLKSIEFTVYSILTDPFVTQKFELPAGTQLIKVPLWGTEEPNEHVNRYFSSTFLAKKRTSDAVISERFLPLFSELVEEIIALEKNAHHIADVLVQLYDLFQEYDYKLSFKSELTWNAYKKIILDAVKHRELGLDEPDIYGLIQSLGWVYRFFNIINTPIPRTTVSHASAAAFCALPCVVAKLKYGTPFLLTEHGVYLREQYLALSKHGYPSFLNSFLIRLVHTMTHLSYTFADQIAPVCEYNTRWEREMTGQHERIEVIYNGVDHNVFANVRQVAHSRPTVVVMARIDPIKDLFTLLRSADIVRQTVPNVRFLIYGSVTVPDYYERCLALRDELHLGDVVEFVGHISDVAKAYEEADVVALSSISEAFPYSIVEAMLAGKAIVTTDVGGIPEALGSHGILVPPLSPDEMAAGITRLLLDPNQAAEFGRNAQERALGMFTLEHSLDHYLKMYIRLGIRANSSRKAEKPERQVLRTLAPPQIKRVLDKQRTPSEWRLPAPMHALQQQLYAERAYALQDFGEIDEAISMLECAVQRDPMSYAAPVLALQLASWMEQTGEIARANDKLAQSGQLSQVIAQNRQQLFLERGLGLLAFGQAGAALQQFGHGIQEDPQSPAVPWAHFEMSAAERLQGQHERAKLAQEKAELLALMVAEKGGV